MEGFNYSSVMAGMHDKKWTYEELNAFLTSPKTYAPGTKMTFAGLKKPEERADVIAYLRTQSDNPIAAAVIDLDAFVGLAAAMADAVRPVVLEAFPTRSPFRGRPTTPR